RVRRRLTSMAKGERRKAKGEKAKRAEGGGRRADGTAQPPALRPPPSGFRPSAAETAEASEVHLRAELVAARVGDGAAGGAEVRVGLDRAIDVADPGSGVVAAKVVVVEHV